MKAWEQACNLLRNARPVVLSDDEQSWEEDAHGVGEKQDEDIKMFWRSKVPGSGAPDSCAIGALGAMENKGYTLPNYSDILTEGLAALDADNMPDLHIAHLRLWRAIRDAVPNMDHPSQKTLRYPDWNTFDNATTWPTVKPVKLDDTYRASAMAGWWAQIIGAAAGTAIEGYTAEQLSEKFGPITDYVRKPNTFNDDITYEICFLEALRDKGSKVSSIDIAEQWVGLIPFGWSAEGVALNHLHRGTMPPESGSIDNPFDEWIGAQMRGAVCGMVTPGDARNAAKLAWMDGQVSHTSNGILGEVFNAVLCAMAFVEPDMRKLTEDTINLISEDTEYGAVLRFALDTCKSSKDWHEAWAICDKHLIEYHWIHVYPNAAAQIVALWFGHDSFDLMAEIICSVGHDVDCNAAQILCAFAVAKGQSSIPQRWLEPLDDDIVTYMRRPTKISMSDLTDQTVEAARAWNS